MEPDNINNFIKLKFNQWIKDLLNYKYYIILSIILFAISITLNIFAGNYTDKVSSAVSDDIILNNIPVINLNFFYTWGIFIVFSILLIYILFFKTNKFHLYIAHFSVLTLIRSFFICLTHLKTPIEAVYTNMPLFLKYVSFQNDLFFSGHVAYSFLGFLLFKDSKIKWFFLFSSIIMAVSVLLMHAHYSIDVFSAYFITYGTFILSNKIFNKLFAKR